jgi:hypothetical protein
VTPAVAAGDEAEQNRVRAAPENDRNRRCLLFRRHRRTGPHWDQHSDWELHQLGSQRPQAVGMTVGKTVFDRHIPADREASLLQSLKEGGPTSGVRRPVAEISDNRQALLRQGLKRHQRRHDGSAPKKVTAPH